MAVQAANAARAGVRVARAVVSMQPVLAPTEVVTARQIACLHDCPECIPFPKGSTVYHRCRKCGCWLDGKYFSKWSLATETCPLGRWEAD